MLLLGALGTRESLGVAFTLLPDAISNCLIGSGSLAQLLNCHLRAHYWASPASIQWPSPPHPQHSHKRLQTRSHTYTNTYAHTLPQTHTYTHPYTQALTHTDTHLHTDKLIHKHAYTHSQTPVSHVDRHHAYSPTLTITHIHVNTHGLTDTHTHTTLADRQNHLLFLQNVNFLPRAALSIHVAGATQIIF